MDNQEQNKEQAGAGAPNEAYTASTEEPATEPAPAEAAETGNAEQASDGVPAADALAAEQPGEAPAAPEPMPFDFGVQNKTPEKKGSFKLFAGVFGGIFGLCVLLLGLTLWLGDAGFKIVREVETERIVYVREYNSESGLLTPQEVTDLGRKSTVTVSVSTSKSAGIGSGFVYSADGYIVTNYHVIEGTLQDATSTIQVVFSDGTAVDATVVGYNEPGDLAVLRVAKSDKLVPVTLGVSGELLVGDQVAAIGTPAKLDYAGTATFGAISATERLITMTDSDGNIVRKMVLLQTDAGVNPGNSGGPLFDMYGRVIGIVVMKVTQYGGTVFDGIGFAIPIDGAKVIVDAIIQDGKFTGQNPIAEGRSLLGVTGHGGTAEMWYSDVAGEGSTVTPSKTEKPGYHYMPVSGIYVSQINGGNAVGKIEVGDIITRVNGLVVRDVNALIAAVNRQRVNTPVKLTVYRGGAEIEIELYLTEEVK